MLILFYRARRWLRAFLNLAVTRQKLENLMATVEDLQNAIDREHEQVSTAVQTMRDEIKALKDQIEGGTVVTAEQLDSLVERVENIFVPTPEETPPPAP